MSSHKFLKAKTPQPIAHRGGSFFGAENTMDCFEHAINMGFKTIETDIQATKEIDAFHKLSRPSPNTSCLGFQIITSAPNE